MTTSHDTLPPAWHPPRWVKVLAPVVAVIVALGGVLIGYGQGRGELAERLGDHERRISRVEHTTDSIAGELRQIREGVGEVRGELRQIARSLGLPPAPNSPTPTRPAPDALGLPPAPTAPLPPGLTPATPEFTP